MDAVLYIHGKNGNAFECEHYKPLFPDCEVIGLDYLTFTPWETGKEIYNEAEKLFFQYDDIILIANSIGAFFSMNADIDGLIKKAYFISPIVDMEKLITDMMKMDNITEEKLRSEGEICTTFGERLSWEYLCYVRNHKIKWDVPTNILYGGNDNITRLATVNEFAKNHNVNLTVMNEGEHWFHTDEQMCFLDNWIKNDR